MKQSHCLGVAKFTKQSHTRENSRPQATFNQTLLINKLKDPLEQAGTMGHYLGHSFRRGAVTWAQQTGNSNDNIQLLGWWSDAYIEVQQENIHSVSLRLQPSLARTVTQGQKRRTSPTCSRESEETEERQWAWCPGFCIWLRHSLQTACAK